MCYSLKESESPWQGIILLPLNVGNIALKRKIAENPYKTSLTIFLWQQISACSRAIKKKY